MMPKNPGDHEQDGAGTTSGGLYPNLSAADERAVDLLIEHGFDLDAAVQANPSEAKRLAAAHALFMRTEAYPVEAPDASLVDATMARIAREEDEREERLKLGSRGVPTLGRGRWADFVALACVALLILSIGMPVLSNLQHRRGIDLCANNLRTLASGLELYTKDFSSRPIAAGFAPDFSGLKSWKKYDNRQHLALLHKHGYCDPACMYCANDATHDGYASMVPHERMNQAWLTASGLPIVADRNPVVFLTRGGRVAETLTMNSLDHDSDGQNVLFRDGAVRFMFTPLIEIRAPQGGPIRTDDIWVPADSAGLEVEFNDSHTPGEWSALDVFLTQ